MTDTQQLLPGSGKLNEARRLASSPNNYREAYLMMAEAFGELAGAWWGARNGLRTKHTSFEVEVVAKALAGHRWQIRPDAPELARVWPRYCGEARAVIAALSLPSGANRCSVTGQPLTRREQFEEECG